jgi:hypothetical protein
MLDSYNITYDYSKWDSYGIGYVNTAKNSYKIIRCRSGILGEYNNYSLVYIKGSPICIGRCNNSEEIIEKIYDYE